MIRLCIFDLDGTLTQTLVSIARAVNGTLTEFGLAPQPLERFRYYVGDGLDTALARALSDAGDPDGVYLSAGIPICRARFAEDPLYQVRPYPEIPALLDALRTHGVRCAVFSNKPHAQAIEVVETIFGKGTFDVIRGQRDDTPKKPDPTGLYRILDSLHIGREESLYIGDSDTDMKTGRAAGIYTVGAAWGFRTREELEENGADRIIERPLALAELTRSDTRPLPRAQRRGAGAGSSTRRAGRGGPF